MTRCNRRAVWSALLLAVVTGFVAGCASTPPNEDNTEVSTLPWNRPQKWEGGSGMGGFRPPGSQ